MKTKYIDLIDPENLVFKMKDLQGNAIELRPFIDLLMESYSIYLPIEANATKSVNKTVDPSVHI